MNSFPTPQLFRLIRNDQTKATPYIICNDGGYFVSILKVRLQLCSRVGELPRTLQQDSFRFNKTHIMRKSPKMNDPAGRRIIHKLWEVLCDLEFVRDEFTKTGTQFRV